MPDADNVADKVNALSMGWIERKEEPERQVLPVSTRTSFWNSVDDKQSKPVPLLPTSTRPASTVSGSGWYTSSSGNRSILETGGGGSDVRRMIRRLAHAAYNSPIPERTQPTQVKTEQVVQRRIVRRSNVSNQPMLPFLAPTNVFHTASDQGNNRFMQDGEIIEEVVVTGTAETKPFFPEGTGRAFMHVFMRSMLEGALFAVFRSAKSDGVNLLDV